MSTDTPHSILLWCNDQDEKVKALQDICLDNPLDEEAKEILRNLVKLQEKIEKLSKDCEEELFT
jgi:hypothetical protein